jgi:hypothetical protein
MFIIQSSWSTSRERWPENIGTFNHPGIDFRYLPALCFCVLAFASTVPLGLWPLRAYNRISVSQDSRRTMRLLFLKPEINWNNIKNVICYFKERTFLSITKTVTALIVLVVHHVVPAQILRLSKRAAIICTVADCVLVMFRRMRSPDYRVTRVYALCLTESEPALQWRCRVKYQCSSV